MRKAKILLMSLAICAALGAALAFKVEVSGGGFTFCTKTYVVGGPSVSICDLSTLLINSLVVPGSPNVYATSLNLEGEPITTTLQCTPELSCPALRLKKD
jgi:hypothetical protein